MKMRYFWFIFVNPSYDCEAVPFRGIEQSDTDPRCKLFSDLGRDNKLSKF